MKRILLLVVPIVLLCACTQNNKHQQYTNSSWLYARTVKQLNNVVLENNFPPMIASRNYVYANIAAYEVMAAGNQQYQTLAKQIAHMPAMPLPEGDTANIDFPLAAMLAFCKVGGAVTFPEGSMDTYVTQLLHEADSVGMPNNMIEASQTYANKVADAVIAWSKGDNYAKLRSAPKYTVTNEPGRWVPTPPMYASAIEPHWRNMRTMVLDSAAACKPVPPPPFSLTPGSTFYAQAKEVQQVIDSLTDEQKHIADFWDDNPFKMNVIGHASFATKKFSPPGHWMNIVGIAAKYRNADFATTVMAYTQSAIALYDGFISCWDEKYRSNYVRPETVIKEYWKNDNWQPYIQTPPFPEYTSGHAVISAATAEVLTHIFGDNVAYTDSSSTEFGIAARSFKSFRAAALEAGLSRVYGGIHYRNSCLVGTEQGKRVGTLVVQRIRFKK
jgi:hypothetical protein